MQLVLASGSPRRRDLLESVGAAFVAIAPDVDERRFPDEDPDSYVLRIAEAKARAVAEPGRVVLAADTTVVHHGRVLGKPAHPAEARAMLERLSGEAHAVHTGVAVAGAIEGSLEVHREVCVSVVRMLPLTGEEIAGYVAGGEPMDKAGAYALQGRGAIFVESVEGSPSNVVGLPLHVAARLLRGFGFDLLSGV